MILYADPCTVNCRKVLAGAALLGVDLVLEYRSYFAGAHRQPDYLKINPNGMLPALKDGDFILWESDVILGYIAERSRSESAFPSDLRARTDIRRWMGWSSSHWFSACYPYLVENAVKPLLGQGPDEAVLGASAETFHHFATVLNDHLAGRSWVVGAAPTIADVSVAAPMHVHTFQKLPLEDYPHIRAWMARVENLPCWQQTDPLPHFPAPKTADPPGP
jgi:glutathione S-transferase